MYVCCSSIAMSPLLVYFVVCPSMQCLPLKYAMYTCILFQYNYTVSVYYVTYPSMLRFLLKYSMYMCIMLQYYYLLSQYTMISAQIPVCYAFCSSITKSHALVYYVAYSSFSDLIYINKRDCIIKHNCSVTQLIR